MESNKEDYRKEILMVNRKLSEGSLPLKVLGLLSLLAAIVSSSSLISIFHCFVEGRFSQNHGKLLRAFVDSAERLWKPLELSNN
jgi:hypothetical protein